MDVMAAAAGGGVHRSRRRAGTAEHVYVQVCDAIVESRLVAGDLLTPSRALADQ
jgi:DNA-binding FadR family transcriptional regulator